MFAIAAAIMFAIAAFVAFGPGGISVAGLACVGAALLAVHLIHPWAPWR